MGKEKNNLCSTCFVISYCMSLLTNSNLPADMMPEKTGPIHTISAQ